jgi:putative ABC transport system permease protein
MIKNYLKTALRSTLNNKVYSIINILGLSIGLGCFVLVIAYNRKELSFDTGFTKASLIYRINTSLDINGVPTHYPMAHFPAGQDMIDEFPGVKSTVRMYRPNLFGGNVPKIKNEEIIFPEEKFYFTDSTFFHIFDLPFKYGDPNTALNNPFSVVLSEPSAIRYFGDVDPVGKLLSYNDTISFKVTGVLKKLNFNTHLNVDFVANARAIIRQNISRSIDLENAYIGLWYYSYIVVEEGTDVDLLRSKLPDFVERHYTDRYKDNNAYLELQNIKDIHLHATNMASGQMSPPGNREYVFILTIVGCAVLIVACFNFVNMATSRYLSRSKEVGLRKAIGAERSQLIFQFITEASLITFFAGLIGLALVITCLPVFNQLANADMHISDILSIQDGVMFMVLFFAVGILSGLYPAFVLSSMKPALVLKGATKSPSTRWDVRKGLVIMQFIVSLVLIIGTLIVLSQLNYLQTKDMGFDRERILVIRDSGTSIFQNYSTFKNKLLETSEVKQVTHLSHDLGQSTLPYYPFKREGKDEEMMLPSLSAGYDFLETYGLSMSQGRYFDINAPGDSTLAFVINESAAKQFGWQDAINRHITFGVNGNPKHRVIGVIKDFNFDPLRTAVGPLVIRFTVAFGEISMKLKEGDHGQQVKEVEKIWKDIFPGAPFSYYFLEDGIANAYQEEQKLAKIYSSFCSLAIFIACLGLFALASYTIEKRKKEMAIRKVLGSTATKITAIIYKEFLILIALAFVVAVPISIMLFGTWLDHFAYRVAIDPWLFVIALSGVLGVSTVTVLYQTIKAGRMNPATILKSE